MFSCFGMRDFPHCRFSETLNSAKLRESFSSQTNLTKTQTYFVTDVHGSDRCFKKFLNAGKFYKASVLILGGDITGKMIVPIVNQGDGIWRSLVFGENMTMKSREQVEEVVKIIRDSGAYPYEVEKKEYDELQQKPEEVHKLFDKLMVEGVARWMALAEERLKGTGIKCFISPGN